MTTKRQVTRDWGTSEAERLAGIVNGWLAGKGDAPLDPVVGHLLERAKAAGERRQAAEQGLVAAQEAFIGAKAVQAEVFAELIERARAVTAEPEPKAKNGKTERARG